jgi:dTDP-4-amino-4,6-dideoxygalactose transaminase
MKTNIRVPLFYPSYDGPATRRALSALFPTDMSNRWLGQGPKVDEFEKAFGDKFGYRYCVSVNSGTSALELAYHLLDIAPGDEIITPVLTCTATNIPLLRMGAKLVFADINDTLTPDYADIKAKLTPRTKAIVVVTLGGLPVDPRIFRLGRPVVVDAAQSTGVGEPRGDLICYSFQAIKHFTTGDGGMLVVRTRKDYRRAKCLRWFGIDRERKIRSNWQPYQRREMTMDIEEPGFKFHMNDIAATMGLVNLRHSDRWLAHRRRIAEYYRRHLRLPLIAGGAYWLACVLVDERDDFARHLREHGIDSNMTQLRNDIFRIFGGRRQNLPRMNTIEPRYVYIPLNTRMSLADAKEVTRVANAWVDARFRRARA